MSDPQPSQSSASSVAVDAAVRRFSAEWQAGKQPRIEDYVDAAPDVLRAKLLTALVRVELELRHEQGEKPDVDEYCRRFADSADAVSQVHADTLRRRSKPPRPHAEETVTLNRSHDTSQGFELNIVEADDVDFAPPRQIGRFEIQEVLGEGAFGTVYRAVDPSLDRDVALKVPRGDLLRTAKQQERFLREARSAAKIHHPHICPVHEVGNAGGDYYIVMAYLEGRPLSKVLASGDVLSQRQAVMIVRKLAMALAEAHRLGIIHRDLKPSNIMIDRRGEPIVMDFGLARRSNRSEDEQLSQSGELLGTPAYMPPEQAKGDLEAIGPPADIYSLGVILYELLAGEKPFQGSMAEVLSQILYNEPPPLSARRIKIDTRLEAVCLRAMAKKIPERFGSMQELAAALTEYLRWRTKSRTPTAVLLPQAAAVPDGVEKPDEPDVIQPDRLRTEAAKPETDSIVVGPIDPNPWSLLPRLPSWFYTGGASLALVMLLGSASLLWPKQGQTTLLVDDAEAEILIDEQPLSREKWNRPLVLSAGQHRLTVKHGDEIVSEQSFQIQSGANPPLAIERPEDQ